MRTWVEPGSAGSGRVCREGLGLVNEVEGGTDGWLHLTIEVLWASNPDPGIVWFLHLVCPESSEVARIARRRYETGGAVLFRTRSDPDVPAGRARLLDLVERRLSDTDPLEGLLPAGGAGR